MDETNFAYVTPKTIGDKADASNAYVEFMKQVHGTYKKLVELGVPREDARFVLPNATETEIVVTANFRALREFIEIRKSEKAQWEIRQLAERMLALLMEKAPNAFGDL